MALHCRGAQAVLLGLFVRFFSSRLGDQPFGFVDSRAQRVLDGLAQGRHLACDLAVQSAHDGGLAFDGLAHAVDQNGRGLKQVDHLIEAVAKEIGCDGHMGPQKHPEKDSIEYQSESFEHWA